MRPDPAGTQLLIRRRRSVRSRLLITAASGAVVLMAAGCSGGGGAGTPVSGTITIAATPGVEDAPLYLAQTRGLFAAEGLHVQITDYGSQAADLAAVESGKAQIADSDYGNVFTVEQSAANLRILADGFDASSGTAEIVTAPNAGIQTPLQLPKYSVGVPASELAAAAAQVLSNYLVSNAQVVNWAPMPEQQEVQELGTGLLKAALLTEPYLYEAESQYGDGELLDAFSGQTANMPMSGYVAQQAWVKANSAAVADFQAAISQAQADSALNGPVQQELPKIGAGITTQTADMVTLGSYPTQTSTLALQRVQTMLSERGLLSGGSQMTVSQLVVPEGG
jgi:NitT/TauT family transport system substrate-binding protein